MDSEILKLKNIFNKQRRVLRHSFFMFLCCLLAIFVLMPCVAYAACALPAGVEGEVIYNSTHNVPQYCDGTNWIAMNGGNPNKVVCPKGQVSCGGKIDERVVFVSSGGKGSNSTETADTKCASEALNAGLSGQYFAWNSKSGASMDPESRFERSNVPYVRTDGARIADDWDDLTDATLINNINRDAYGQGISTVKSTWTWTNSDGTFNSAATCSTGTPRGNVNSGTSAWTAQSAAAGCSTGGRFYCFEQKSDQTKIVPNGLVGHWRFDETSGTHVQDSSGTGAHGVFSSNISSSDSVEGVIGGALRLNANSDMTITHPSLDNIDELTVCFWVKHLKSSSGSVIDLFSKSGAYSFKSNRRYLSGRMDFGGYRDFDFSGTGVSAELWHHRCGTYSAASGHVKHVFVNGALAEGATCNSCADPGDDAGNSINFGTNFSTFYLDDLRIYNRVLSAAEMTKIYEARENRIRYNAGKRVPEYFDGSQFVAMTPGHKELDGLVGHWTFNETSGTTVYDKSGNGYDGTMVNGLDAGNSNTLAPVGRGLEFDGHDDYVNVADGFSEPFKKDFSISFWANTVNYFPAYTRAMLGTYDNGGGASLSVSYLASRIGFQAGTDSVGTSNGSWVHGVWNHVTVTRDDAGILQIYINKVKLAEKTDATIGDMALTINDFFRIGERQVANQPFYGVLDDVRIYNRVLSPEEVTYLYDMGLPPSSSTALPQGCPNIGDVCDDGTIYAGLSPDGNVSMFTTPEDAGNMPWNNGNTSGYTIIPSISGDSGAANTNAIVRADSDSVTAGFQPHQAAQACTSLVAHGSTDWYLPSLGEIGILYSAKDEIGNFTTSGFPAYLYWASNNSSTLADHGAWMRFSDGSFNAHYASKHYNGSVRCVRKGPAPRCANPYGLEGQMTYNSTHDVMQYCDGTRWIAIGKMN